MQNQKKNTADYILQNYMETYLRKYPTIIVVAFDILLKDGPSVVKRTQINQNMMEITIIVGSENNISKSTINYMYDDLDKALDDLVTSVLKKDE